MLSVSVYKIRYIYKHNTHPRTNDTCSLRYTRTCATPQSCQSINSHRLLLLTTSVSEATASTHPRRIDAVPSETIYSAVNAQDIQFNWWLQVTSSRSSSSSSRHNITCTPHRLSASCSIHYHYLPILQHSARSHVTPGSECNMASDTSDDWWSVWAMAECDCINLDSYLVHCC